MKILFWIVYRYLLCVLQVIIKIVINIEYIKIIEFVEVEKFVGSEFVLGVNLFEGLGKQGLIEYCKLIWVFIYFRYLLKEGEVFICFVMYGDFMILIFMVYVLRFNDIVVLVCDYSISVFYYVVILKVIFIIVMCMEFYFLQQFKENRL